MVIGAVNALLVARFLRPVGRFASWFGGLFYAVFWPAVYSEHTVLLEGLANTCLLLALLLVSRSESRVRPTAPRVAVAGMLLGTAASIKIWGVVPVMVLFVFLLFSAGVRRALLFLVGAVAGATAICLPFFTVAPRTMWRMVVLDQLQRPTTTPIPAVERLNDIMGLSLYQPPEDKVTVALVVTLALLLLACVAAALRSQTRPTVVLLLSMGALLLPTPAWFLHYSALTAAVLAIVAGAGGDQLVRLVGWRGVPRLRTAVGAALVVALVVVSLPVAQAHTGSKFPGRTLGPIAAARSGCVTSDHPSALILLNALSRNLDRGCRLVVDLGGASYDLTSHGQRMTTRKKNRAFQKYAIRYLRSGNTMVYARFHLGFGLSDTSHATVVGWPIVARADRYSLRQPN